MLLPKFKSTNLQRSPDSGSSTVEGPTEGPGGAEGSFRGKVQGGETGWGRRPETFPTVLPGLCVMICQQMGLDPGQLLAGSAKQVKVHRKGRLSGQRAVKTQSFFKEARGPLRPESHLFSVLLLSDRDSIPKDTQLTASPGPMPSALDYDVRNLTLQTTGRAAARPKGLPSSVGESPVRTPKQKTISRHASYPGKGTTIYPKMKGMRPFS